MVDVNSPIENEQREQDAILALGSLRGNLSSSSISPLDLSTADNSRDLSRRSSAALTPFEGPSPWTSTTSLHSLQDPNIPDARFFDRVSHLPYIASAVRAYELGRNSSRVVKVSNLHRLFLPPSRS